MANQVILPAQKIALSDLRDSFPNKKIKKIFFQCQLKSISGNDATFGVIAYAGKKNVFQEWIIGSEVSGSDDGSKPGASFGIPIAFGNNELVDFNLTQKEKKSKKTDPKKIKQDELMGAILKILNGKDKEKLKSSYLVLTPKKTKNPHVTYDVTLDTSSASTNPSPPAPPQ